MTACCGFDIIGRLLVKEGCIMREAWLRWGFFLIGLVILGLGVALTIKGQRFGVGSWDVLHIGLFKQLGLTIGSWSIIAGVVIVIIAAIGMREFPKIGTFINMTTVGLVIDFFNWLIPDPTTLIWQLTAFISGIILIGLGGGVYISAELGAGPRDSLMLLIVSKTRLSIRTARTIMEVTVAIAGYLLGGPIGVGTVVMVFTLGPIMQLSMNKSVETLHRIIEIKAKEKIAEG